MKIITVRRSKRSPLQYETGLRFVPGLHVQHLEYMFVMSISADSNPRNDLTYQSPETLKRDI
jgi:hypothetical protein